MAFQSENQIYLQLQKGNPSLNESFKDVKRVKNPRSLSHSTPPKKQLPRKVRFGAMSADYIPNNDPLYTLASLDVSRKSLRSSSDIRTGQLSPPLTHDTNYMSPCIYCKVDVAYGYICCKCTCDMACKPK